MQKIGTKLVPMESFCASREMSKTAVAAISGSQVGTAPVQQKRAHILSREGKHK